ncbi:toxin-activating lysine-acyltransferase [Xanthomonas sacchari]|uniref:toxin-activating lysine-acyltransferase n=1 Tax=Xanthomonas sacchari TaxID=56458 RepID=UPI00224EF9FE|nr:toxin-activating lysine-acyltransferase [Xanthomonas sacchari]MCW0447184.1 hypothetical protein [Xanthomonas sacchari]
MMIQRTGQLTATMELQCAARSGSAYPLFGVTAFTDDGHEGGQAMHISEKNPNPLSNAFLEEIGAVAFLMAQHERHGGYTVRSLPTRISPAAMTRQIRIYYSPHGAPLGYITWAWLSEEAEHRWITMPDAPLHQSEWTDGETLWIIDFLSAPGFGRKIFNHARKTLFSDQRSVKALRRSADGNARKVSTWRRNNGIWCLDTIWHSTQGQNHHQPEVPHEQPRSRRLRNQ